MKVKVTPCHVSVQVKMGGGDRVPNLSQPECLNEWVVSTAAAPLYLRKDPVPTVREEAVWTDTEILVTTGIQSPDRQAVSSGFYMTYAIINGQRTH